MCLRFPVKSRKSMCWTACVPGVSSLAASTRRPASISYRSNVGDYVMVHVGFAISVVDKDEAERTYALLESMGVLRRRACSGWHGSTPS